MNKEYSQKEIGLITTLLRNTPMLYYMIDKDWKFVFSEGQLLKNFGLVPGQIVGMSVSDLYGHDEAIMKLIGEALAGKTKMAVNYSEGIYYETYFTPYFGQNGDVELLSCLSFDITEQRLAQKELEKIRVFQEALINSIPGMLYLYNSNQELVYWNEAHKTMTGYNDEEIDHCKLSSWFGVEEFRNIQKELANMEKTGVASAESIIIRKDGTTYPMFFTASPLTINDEIHFVGIGINVSDKVKAEQELMELNKTLEQKVEKRTAELQKSNEDLIALNEELIALNDELSEKNDEISKINQQLQENNLQILNMQKQLVESEKMVALGTLVAGVAHEVNTPIGVSITAASHLSDISKSISAKRERKESIEEDLEYFFEDLTMATNMIEKNLSRAGNLVQSFKQLSVDQSNEVKRYFDIGQYVDETVLSLTPSYKKSNIKLEVTHVEGLMIHGWPGALAQIITNLLFNATQHAYTKDQQGLIKIEIQDEDEFAVIRFSDNGKGISKDIQQKIFEPFFTTNRESGGTGLGLSIVYSLVTQRYNGTIQCESELEKGTVFTIRIPLGEDFDD